MRKQYIITKPRSSKRTEITCIDDDDWFYDLKHMSKGKVSEHGMIIKKDLHLWLDNFRARGFSVEERDI